jgi:tight adherence protein B
MDSDYALFVIVGFLAVVLLIDGIFLLWVDTRSPELQRIKQRLRTMATGEAGVTSSALVKQRLLSEIPAVHQWLSRVPMATRLDSLLLQASSSQNLAQLLAVCLLGSAVGLLLLGMMGANAWWAGFVSLTLLCVPLLRLLWRRANRLQKMRAQLPDTLDLICRALRAGHAFSAALATVGSEAPEPIASEFKITFDEINFGISTKNALLNLANRVPLADMRYFVLAVIIQLETGGNLANLLSMLAHMIRERFKLFGRIRVLAAEGKLSAYILTALPFFVTGVLQLVNPNYVRVLFTDPSGQRLISIALVMMGFGIVLLWRITKIRV